MRKLCSLKPLGENVFRMAEASKRESVPWWSMAHGEWRVRSRKWDWSKEPALDPTAAYFILFRESFQKLEVVPKFHSNDFWKMIYIYNSSGWIYTVHSIYAAHTYLPNNWRSNAIRNRNYHQWDYLYFA